MVTDLDICHDITEVESGVSIFDLGDETLLSEKFVVITPKAVDTIKAHTTTILIHTATNPFYKMLVSPIGQVKAT